MRCRLLLFDVGNFVAAAGVGFGELGFGGDEEVGVKEAIHPAHAMFEIGVGL